MKKSRILPVFLATICIILTSCQESPRKVTLLDKGWMFHLGESAEADISDFSNTVGWEEVTIPHDWAIYGPFDRSHDLQDVAIYQNFEYVPSVKTGRTGGLPYIGVGWYRRTFDVNDDKEVTLLFDGAMSEARIYVNGHEVIFWPYGYNSFYCDITDYITENGRNNKLAVRLENRPFSSRWYPGAGLYRNVYLIETEQVHVPVWGSVIRTEVAKDYSSAKVHIITDIEGIEYDDQFIVRTQLRDQAGVVIASTDLYSVLKHEAEKVKIEQILDIDSPRLWSPETPDLYTAETSIYTLDDNTEQLEDIYSTTFGVRTIEVRPETGFYLNGVNRKFKGVCLHHDLGPLGAAVNKSAIRHQLKMLKDMGCDAIRTTHNMPAPELIELCDEMGFMVIVENFDEWDVAKCENGYHRFFEEWAEKDMINMLHHYRNSPSIIMWSIGNEVPTQWSPDGYKVAKFLQEICHREDPTRLVTCGMDQVDAVLNNGFAAILDVPGFNYRAHKYVEGYEKLPQKILLGSETSSTVSSRGVYKFPAECKATAIYEDHHCSSYDTEYCSWSNIPDDDFALADDYPWTMGQFVWTGFDYLGEPTPYDNDAWPNHSSMFGIIDLASIPKDRYYLYRSLWNEAENTLHILPHWNWPGREGKVTPVFVYTSYPSAELFVNGISQGRRTFSDNSRMERYRLMWNEVVYQPGEITVVAYNEDGSEAERKSVRTSGEAKYIDLKANCKNITADGKDLMYITVRVLDKDGNLCPHDSRKIRFSVEGAGVFRAVANGDPTCLELFHIPEMSAFNGMLTAIVQSKEKAGAITLTASAEGLEKSQIRFDSVKE